MKQIKYLAAATLAIGALTFTGCSAKTGTNLGRALDGNGTMYDSTYGTGTYNNGYNDGTGTMGSYYGNYYDGLGYRYFGDTYAMDNGYGTGYSSGTIMNDYMGGTTYGNTANGHNYNLGSDGSIKFSSGNNGGVTGTLYGDDSGYSTYMPNK